MKSMKNMLKVLNNLLLRKSCSCEFLHQISTIISTKSTITTSTATANNSINSNSNNNNLTRSCLKLLNFMHFVPTFSSSFATPRLLNFFIIRQFFYCHKKSSGNCMSMIFLSIVELSTRAKNQGGNSQNFLGKFIRFIVT